MGSLAARFPKATVVGWTPLLVQQVGEIRQLHGAGTFLRVDPALGSPPMSAGQAEPNPRQSTPKSNRSVCTKERARNDFLNSHPRVVAMCTFLHECIFIHIIASETRIPPV